MASQKYERAILEPPHAAFGYPLLSLGGGAVGAVMMGLGYFLSALVVIALVHVASMVLRHRAPHGEQLFLRSFGKSEAVREPGGDRRVYHG